MAEQSGRDSASEKTAEQKQREFLENHPPSAFIEEQLKATAPAEQQPTAPTKRKD